jgi:hypothetical protein
MKNNGILYANKEQKEGKLSCPIRMNMQLRKLCNHLLVVEEVESGVNPGGDAKSIVRRF